MGHWVRLPGTQAYQSLATLRSGMEHREVEEEGRLERGARFLPQLPRPPPKEETILVNSGLGPQ